MQLSILELFSGIGGFTKGLQQAGFKFKNHYFSEINKHSIANYKYNFPDAKYLGSVTDISGDGISPDIITFGSPCQDFSLAGKRLGMEGQRSSLIMEAIRLITETRPSVFIWENVKGVFSSNNGADFWAVIAAFANIGGYRLEWQLLNTSWLLPQNRERIYLIGHLAGRSEPGVFPIRESAFIHPERQCTKSGSIARTLNAGDNKSWVGNFIKQVNPAKEFGSKPQQRNRVYDPTGIAPCLNASRTDEKTKIIVKHKLSSSQDGQVFDINGISQCLSAGHGNVPNIEVRPISSPDIIHKTQNGRRIGDNDSPSFTLTGRDRHGVMISSNTIKGCEVLSDGDSLNLQNIKSKTRRGRIGKGLSQTLDTKCNQAVFSGVQIRRLTEIECERLQGFPDDWTKYGDYEKQVWINKKEKTFEIVEHTKEIPKTHRYQMCGNAVTVDIVEMIGKKLIKQIICN